MDEFFSTRREFMKTLKISGGSESDHYRCPICSLLLGKGQKLSLGEFQVSGVSNVHRGEE